jgi:hypothetical protein
MRISIGFSPFGQTRSGCEKMVNSIIVWLIGLFACSVTTNEYVLGNYIGDYFD